MEGIYLLKRRRVCQRLFLWFELPCCNQTLSIPHVLETPTVTLNCFDGWTADWLTDWRLINRSGHLLGRVKYKIHILTQKTRKKKNLLCTYESVHKHKVGNRKWFPGHVDSALDTCSFLLIYCLLTARVVSKSLRQPVWAQTKHLSPLKTCYCCCSTGPDSATRNCVWKNAIWTKDWVVKMTQWFKKNVCFCRVD